MPGSVRNTMATGHNVGMVQAESGETNNDSLEWRFTSGVACGSASIPVN
jgi:hypothetical protein